MNYKDKYVMHDTTLQQTKPKIDHPVCDKNDRIPRQP